MSTVITEVRDVPFPLARVPVTWRISTVGDCCISINDGDWIETKDQGGEDYRLLQISNVGLGSFRETGNYRFISQETFNRLSCREVVPGNIIVARMPDPTGRAWYVQPMPFRAITAVDVAILEPNADILDGQFCAYYLNSPYNLNHAKARAGGTTRERITRKDLATFPLPLPPLSVQKRIAGILSAYDELIENSQRRIRILESMARALYREWFVHFRFPSHESHPRIASPLGEIPQGWDVRQLKDVCRLTMGQSPKSEFYNEVGEGVPFHQGVTNFGDRFPTDRLFCTAEGRIGLAGDILFSVRAPVGRMNIANKKIILGRGLSAIRHNDGCQEFLWEQLRSHFTRDDMIGNGAIFASVTKSDMQGIKLICPPLSLIERATKHFEPMHSEIASLSQQIHNLRHTRDLLLPRLLSGQVTVEELVA